MEGTGRWDRKGAGGRRGRLSRQDAMVEILRCAQDDNITFISSSTVGSDVSAKRQAA